MSQGSGFSYAYSKNKRAPLFIKRKVANAQDIYRWYETQGMQGLLDPEEYHATVAHSREPVEWHKNWVAPEALHVTGGERIHDLFGPERDDFVLRFNSPELNARHTVLRANGCSHDFPEYHPHITIGKSAVPPDSVQPYTGPIFFQPEEFEDIWVEYNPEEAKGFWTDPIIFSMPIIIKASEASGRRIIEVEASCEKVDLEGDVILQKALLNSAKTFIQNGHLDIDHKSEPAVAMRLGIWNPEHYIIGRPLEVHDGGAGRTFVKAEIRRSPDGTFDPEHRTYDMFWDSVTSVPPVIWYASVFGMPIKSLTKNCRNGACEHGASRFLIEGMDWRSLAVTKNPVNNALKGEAKIISAKSWAAIVKSTMGAPVGGLTSLDGKSMVEEAMKCGNCGSVLKAAPSVPAWRRHLIECKGMDPQMADLCAHGLEYKRLLDSTL